MGTGLRISLVMMLLVGCLASDDDVAAVEQPLTASQCPIWLCGSNSPVIAGHETHEINIYGVVNTEGFQLLSFKKNGISYGFRTTNAVIWGYHWFFGNLTGQNLVGAQLVLLHVPSNFRYAIRINAVNPNLMFWAQLQGVTSQPIATSYKLEWTKVDAAGNPVNNPPDWKNLCSKAVAERVVDPNAMPGEHTVVFEGDRIDKVKKEVGATIEPNWVNFGCAGHTLAKLFLTGHTEAGKRYGFVTTTVQRQTMLKMFVADYCGTGKPYTVAGVEVAWKDALNWMQYGPPNLALQRESTWTAAGAACLDVARIDANPTSLPVGESSIDVFPLGAVMTMQNDLCAIPPPCANGNVFDLLGSHVATADPP